MSPDELRRIKQIFEQALDRPASERAAYVKQACRGSSELQTRVETFLRLSEQEDPLLDSNLPDLLRLDPAAGDNVPELPAGALLHGRYQIDALLERSPDSGVYLAKDQKLFDKPVIIKVVRRTGEDPPVEARALGAVAHPSIPAILDYGELENGDLFVAVQYVRGTSLRSALREGRFGVDRAMRCMRQLCAAVASAHDAGIWHLDLKPENVILTDPGKPEERVSLLDFGVARLAGKDRAIIGGSPGYMAPEQAAGNPVLQSDVYSLGVLMYEMLAGTLPASPAEAAGALSAVRPPVPRPIRAAIQKALAPDARARFGSCREFLEALELPDGWMVRKAAAASVLLLLLLATAVIWISSRRMVQSRPLPIPPAQGSVQWLTFAPDGKQLYYAAGSYFFEYMDIFACDLATGKTRALTTDGTLKINPRCSPDGKQIAFVRDRGLNVGTVVVMPTSGGAEREFLTGYVGVATWRSDSGGLVIPIHAENEKWPHLRALDLDTSDSWDMTPPPMQGRGDWSAALSPDGKTLAFVRKESRESSDIFALAVDAKLHAIGSPRRLTSLRIRIADPHWSADGKELIFAAGTLSNYRLYRAAADGRTEPREIAEVGAGIETLAMAAKTGRIALTKAVSESSTWSLDLATMRTKRIPLAQADAEDPALSPDGRRIAYVSSASGEPQVWIADAGGSNARQITFEPSVDGIDPIWLPDSSGVIASVRSKAFGVRNFVFQPPGAPGREMNLDGVPVRFSRDGAWLYFNSRKTGDIELYKYSMRTGEIQQATSKQRAEFGMESPDGKTLYYSLPEEDRGLWKMPAGGGAAVQVLPKLARRSLFDVGSQGIYYVAREARQAVIRLRRFSDGSESELLRLTAIPGWGFGLTPDERTLMFSQYDTESSTVLLLDGLR